MERNEAIRKEILFQLYAHRLTVDTNRIHKDAVKGGYDYSKSEIQSECQFLADEKLIVRDDQKGSSAKSYRIHADGVKHYEQNFAA